MKRKYLLLCAVVFFSISKNYSQEMPKKKVESQRLMNLYNKLEGTYQIQIINSREEPAIPLTIMDSIEIKRQQITTVYFWLKSNVRVMVPAYSVINKQGFSPLERVKYLSSTDIN
ncbi:MAG: hypothetical protein ABI448_15445 [Bacteroidia bacterium]